MEQCFRATDSMCLPIVHWWEGHGAPVHDLSRWRRQWDVLVVRPAQRPSLIGHRPAPVVVVTSSARNVSCSHLSGQNAGRRTRVGVGVASVVHRVGVMVQIGTATPDGGKGGERESCTEWTHQIRVFPRQPVLWRHGAFGRGSSVSVDRVPMVRSQLLVQSHHVPLLAAVPCLADLLHLPL